MDYFVLKGGRILGPFGREELATLLADGTIDGSDFAQAGGSKFWTPLDKLFAADDEAAGDETAPGPLAPDWPTIAVWFWRRLRYSFEHDAARLGVACLVIGLILLVLAMWPPILWLPAFAAAALVGLWLVRQGSAFPAIAILLGSVIVPFGFFIVAAFVRPPAPREQIPLQVNRVEPPAPTSAPAPIALPEPVAAAPLPIASASSEPSLRSATPAPAEVVRLAPSVPAPALPTPARTPPAAELPPLPAPIIPEPAKPQPTPQRTVASASLTQAVKEAVAALPPLDAVSDGRAANLVRDFSNSLLIVEEGGVQGSGFICGLCGNSFAVSNIHVVAGMRAPAFTRLDRVPLQLGAGAAAVDHDIVRYAAPPNQRPLEIMTSVETGAAIGDEVVVLGNSEGARVIHPLAGKLVGIGPNLVEVTAEFVPGNSGSPIIHVNSGKVIGVATYAVQRDMEWLSGDSKQKKIRRFGYRLDSVKTWQPLSQSFAAEKAECDRIEARTADLARLLDDMRDDGVISATRHQNPAIQGPVRSFVEVAKRNGISATDRMQNRKNFMASMRSASQGDIIQAGSGCATTTSGARSARKSASASSSTRSSTGW